MQSAAAFGARLPAHPRLWVLASEGETLRDVRQRLRTTMQVRPEDFAARLLMLVMTLGLMKIQLRSYSCPSAEAGSLCGQVPKLAALAAGLELTAQQLAYCQHNTSATNCSRLPPLLPVSKQPVHVHLLLAGESVMGAYGC